MARRALTTALVAAIALVPSMARAESPARVSVVMPTCQDALDEGELARLLRIELTSDGVRDVRIGEDDAALATIRIQATPCSKDVADVSVTVEDRATAKTVRRTFSVTDVAAPSRARALSLSISELLRASWSELASPAAPAPQTAVPPDVVRAVTLRAPRPEPAEARRTPLLARAVLDTRLFPARGTVVLGPGLGVSIPITGPLVVRADAQLGFGRARDALGDIDVILATGHAGLLLSGGSAAVRFEVGPTVAAGYGHSRGEPLAGSVGASGSALVVTAQASSLVAVTVAPRWWGVLGVDAGAVLRGLDAQSAGRTSAGFGGPLLGASLGVAREL